MASPESERATAVRPAVEGIIDRLASTRIASAMAIVVVALCCFLPGFGAIPPVDRDEPRYAETARLMVAQGDLLDSRFEGQTAVDLPVGMVWLEAAAVFIAGGDRPPIWVYRLPSLLAGVGAALLTWWMALAFGRPRAALLAGLFMAANVVLAGEARLARPDAVLLAAIVAAEGALARLWIAADADRADPRLAAVFWAAIGFGTLVAGPTAPIVIALTLLVLTIVRGDPAWLKRLAPVWGIPLMLLVAAPLLLPLAAGGGGVGAGGIFGADVGLDTRSPPGTYGLLFFAIFWPGASFFVLAVPWMLERLRQPAILFAVAWGVPWWLAAEFVPDKLPHFVLPALPAAALLAATAIDRGQIAVTGRMSLFFSLGPVLFASVLLLGAPLVVVLAGGGAPFTAFPALVVGAGMAWFTWVWLRKGSPLAAAGLSIAASIPLFLGLFGFLLPAFDRPDVSGRVLALASASVSVSCANPRFASAGFVEPSLVHLAPTPVRFTDGAGAADFLDATPGCPVALVENRQLSTFRQRAEDLGIDLANYGRVAGISLGANRRVNVRLFGVAADAR